MMHGHSRPASRTQRWCGALVTLLIGPLALTACASTASFHATNPDYKRSQRPPAEIRLYTEGRIPPKKSIDVGVIVSLCRGIGCDMGQKVDEVLEAMREEASRRGLDGVRAIHCAPPGTVGAGTCQGFGIVFGDGGGE
jgi:hypothetical protein